jgi:hypothetical protein
MIDLPVAWLMLKTWSRRNHFLVAAVVCWTVALVLSTALWLALVLSTALWLR